MISGCCRSLSLASLHMCELYQQLIRAFYSVYKFRCISTFFEFTCDALDWIDLCKLIVCSKNCAVVIAMSWFLIFHFPHRFLFSIVVLLAPSTSKISMLVYISIRGRRRKIVKKFEHFEVSSSVVSRSLESQRKIYWKKLLWSWFLSDLILTHSANTSIENI